ncbi:MAG: DUF3343 domain-containing protein [Clostridia bacterium]|nr:DUF3343 domain-containing protein [Clostridia bacterium]
MYVLAVFLNRNETLKFERALKQKGVNAMVVSTPKGLGSSCSVSVKFYLKDVSKARYLLIVGNYKSFNHFFKINISKNGVSYEIINI